MTPDFFDRLEAELGAITGAGAHLDPAARQGRRVPAVTRRATAIAVLILVLAASLVSEFPASAGGHAIVAHGPALRGL